MNTRDLKRHFFIVLTHAENCRCEDLHHKPSNRHEIGEECKAVKELQTSIAAAREYLKSVGLNGI